MKDYFAASKFEEVAKAYPGFAVARANYKPEEVWKDVRDDGFEASRLRAYLAFPLDHRFIYYSEHPHLLDRHSPDFAKSKDDNEFLVTVPEPRKASETSPVFSTSLVGLHVHERGSVVFPREIASDDLLAHRDANIAEPAWRVLRGHFGLSGNRAGDEARRFVAKLFRIAFAVLHAPSYQSEHKSALSSDWAHLPIPKDAGLLAKLVDAGEQVTRLLDANRNARDVVEAVLTPTRAKLLGQMRRSDGGQITADDLKLTVTYWGGGKGRWTPRPFLEPELPGSTWEQVWGERTGDLFINGEAHFAHVPEAVWTYQIGGYPVLKKWLGYRQADRRDGKPLTEYERRWLRQMIQRIAALLALGPFLDALYQEAAASSFTAVELENPSLGRLRRVNPTTGSHRDALPPLAFCGASIETPDLRDPLVRRRRRVLPRQPIRDLIDDGLERLGSRSFRRRVGPRQSSRRQHLVTHVSGQHLPLEPLMPTDRFDMALEPSEPSGKRILARLRLASAQKRLQRLDQNLRARPARALGYASDTVAQRLRQEQLMTDLAGLHRR